MANEKNEKKEVAKKKAKGPGLFARIGKFFREVFGEVKKVSWPTKLCPCHERWESRVRISFTPSHSCSCRWAISSRSAS